MPKKKASNALIREHQFDLEHAVVVSNKTVRRQRYLISALLCYICIFIGINIMKMKIE